MKTRIMKTIPWLITGIAFYYAFKGIDWAVFLSHITNTSPALLFIAVFLTCLSYFFRARRWQFLFPKATLDILSSFKVLILGFFMNNILPARAGELVRAHMGAQVSGESRTLVLATVASERLTDGLMLSLMFVAFALGLGDEHLSENLLYVALLFGVATLCVILLLVFRNSVFNIVNKIESSVSNNISSYILDRIKVFITGLSPLSASARVPIISLWTIVIWFIELGVYIAITKAFGATLSLPYCVLFLVTVNFSSLIPAAPGGFGVIEAVTSAVLVSVGIEKEHALSMVFTQHILQYLVVGIPGLYVVFSWKSKLKDIKKES